MNTYLQDLLTVAVNDKAEAWSGGGGFAAKRGAGLMRTVGRRRTLAHAATGTGTLATVGAVAWGAVAQPWQASIATPGAAGPCPSPSVSRYADYSIITQPAPPSANAAYSIVGVMSSGFGEYSTDLVTLEVDAQHEVVGVVVTDSEGTPIPETEWSWTLTDRVVRVVMDGESGSFVATIDDGPYGNLGVQINTGKMYFEDSTSAVNWEVVEVMPGSTPIPTVTCLPMASPSPTLLTITYEVLDSPGPSSFPRVTATIEYSVEPSPAP